MRYETTKQMEPGTPEALMACMPWISSLQEAKLWLVDGKVCASSGVSVERRNTALHIAVPRSKLSRISAVYLL